MDKEDYLTPTIERRIEKLIAEGKMNPRDPACDFVAEVASGAPLEEALTNWTQRYQAGDVASQYTGKKREESGIKWF